jgi:uncharacterized protein (DUF2132 family)
MYIDYDKERIIKLRSMLYDLRLFIENNKGLNKDELAKKFVATRPGYKNDYSLNSIRKYIEKGSWKNARREDIYLKKDTRNRDSLSKVRKLNEY